MEEATTSNATIPISTAAMDVDVDQQQQVTSKNGIVCAPGRRPSQRGILVAMQRSNHALSNILQTKLVWSVLNLPNDVLRRSSTIVHGAMGIGNWVAEEAMSAYSFGTVALGGLGSWSNRRTSLVSSTSASSSTSGTIEAMSFVRNFEIEYGHNRPNFERSSFMQALARAAAEFKFLFAYLHSTDSTGTSSTSTFCQQTLCADSFVQFINANFISWGADARSSEGFQVTSCLKACTFPFCAVIAASSPQQLVMLQQVDGQKSAQELIAILKSVMEDRGGALLVAQADKQERLRNKEMREQEDRHAVEIDNQQEEEEQQQQHEPEHQQHHHLSLIRRKRTAAITTVASTGNAGASGNSNRRRRWFLFGRGRAT